MKWVRFQHEGQSPRVGVWQDEHVYPAPPGVTIQSLLQQHGELRTPGEQLVAAAAERIEHARVELLAPIESPPSFRDFMVYEEHVSNCVRHFGGAVASVWYQRPAFYFSNPAAIHGPHEPVAIAPGSQRFDFEIELGAIVGTEASDLDPQDAASHIAGYVLLCDWSARDVQFGEREQGFGPVKGKDTATSLGPVLLTPDELDDVLTEDGFDLRATATHNGTQIVDSSLLGPYWSFGEMLAYASRGTRLRPGDLIGSGTVGNGCLLEKYGLDPDAPWLRPTDQIEIEIERLGTIRTRITDAAGIIPLRPAASAESAQA